MLLKYLVGFLLILEVFCSEISKDDRKTRNDDNDDDNIIFRDDDGHLVKLSKDTFNHISKQYYKANKHHKKEHYDSRSDLNRKENEIIDYSFDGKSRNEKSFNKKWKNEKKQRFDSELQSLNDNKYKDRKSNHYEKYNKHSKKYDYDDRLLHDTDVNNYVKKGYVDKDSELIDIENSDENVVENYQNKDDVKVKRVKKDFYKELKFIDLSKPPSHNDTVMIARYIIHEADWASVATHSSHDNGRGYPFVNILSMSDGAEGKGIGIPFFYLTPLDLSSEDLAIDNKCALTATLAQTEECHEKSLDPQDPRCARVILSGKIKKVRPDSTEEEFAKEAVFSRHPAMKDWPADHDWYLAKMKIKQIVVLDYFGGAKHIDVQEYLNAGLEDDDDDNDNDNDDDDNDNDEDDDDNDDDNDDNDDDNDDNDDDNDDNDDDDDDGKN